MESPMDVIDRPYIFMEVPEIAEKYIYDETLGGKWLLHINHGSMNSMWNRVCKAYQKGYLYGVRSIKATTAMHTNKVNRNNKHMGVIMLHCGPFDNERLIEQYGKCAVRVLESRNLVGCIPYKSDAQSAAKGSINSLYYVPCGKQSTLYNNYRPSHHVRCV